MTEHDRFLEQARRLTRLLEQKGRIVDYNVNEFGAPKGTEFPYLIIEILTLIPLLMVIWSSGRVFD